MDYQKRTGMFMLNLLKDLQNCLQVLSHPTDSMVSPATSTQNLATTCHNMASLTTQITKQIKAQRTYKVSTLDSTKAPALPKGLVHPD